MAAKTALRRRIAPAVPLSLDLNTDSGGVEHFDFRLVFDFNAVALVEETVGMSLLSGEVVEHLTGSALSVMFWAAVLAYHPEYAGPDGLTVIHSYMDARNAPAITQAVMDAFIASLPPAQQEAIRAERGEPEPPGNGRPTRPVPAPTITTGRAGSSSGPLPDTISDSPGMNLAN